MANKIPTPKECESMRKMLRMTRLQFLWYGLACQTGIPGLNPLSMVSRCKRQYPHLCDIDPKKEEENISEQINLMGEAITTQFKKTFKIK